MKKMKKKLLGIAAAILCVAILLPVMLLSGSAASGDLPIVVASDLHIVTPEQFGSLESRDNGLTDSGMYSYVDNTKAALSAESTAIFKRFLSNLSSTSSKYVLITGDIVDMGNEAAHAYAAKEFAKAAEKTGKKILVVPGNNDVCYSFSKEKFEETYNNFGFSGALARHSGSLSYTYDLDDNYRLIAIDSTVYVEGEKVDTGKISEDLLNWITAQAAQAKADGKNPIAMLHHNVLRHTKGIFSMLVDYKKDFYVDAPSNLGNKFADAGIKYVFSGHTHIFDIASKATAKGNSIYDVATGSLSAYPCAYRRVTFSDSSVSFSTKYISKIDKSYLPRGYTEEQLNSMKASLQDYAYGVAETSVKYTVKGIADDPKAISDKLVIEDLDKDGRLAAEIEDLVPVIYEYIGRPIYKQDQTDGLSFEELAAKYKYTLPESNYETCYDIVAAIITSHMSGDENIRSGDVEIKLLKNIAKIILLEAFKQRNTDVSALAEKLGLSNLRENVFNYTASFGFKETVANQLADIFMAPVIEGFTVDAYEPDDNNATLPSYSAESIIPSGAEAAYIMCIKVLEFMARIVHTVFHIV
ncbi:MAG: metallophosphoesterase [Clostridiales bacterium]|nr:metallophosphoesterase [Clostridiales bacterium]